MNSLNANTTINYYSLGNPKIYPSRKELLLSLLPNTPNDTTNAAYLVNGSCLYGAFLADDGSWDFSLIDDNLCMVDSGQLGEAESISYDEVMETVLSFNFSSVYEIVPIPWHVYEVWLNMAEHIE